MHAAGANDSHGIRCINEDKRKAVTALLTDAEWSQWSSREIARRCMVGHKLVDKIRNSLAPSASEKPPRKFKDKHGNKPVACAVLHATY